MFPPCTVRRQCERRALMAGSAYLIRCCYCVVVVVVFLLFFFFLEEEVLDVLLLGVAA